MGARQACGALGCVSRCWPSHQPVYLSSPLPHCPNPSSGYVQAAGLKSDPGGRRPFLLIRNRDAFPQSPSSLTRPLPHPGSLSWGYPQPLVTQGRATLHLGSPVTKGNVPGLPERSQTTQESLHKGYFRQRLEGGAGSVPRPGMVHSELPGHGSVPGLVPGSGKRIARPCVCPCLRTCPGTSAIQWGGKREMNIKNSLK